METNNICDQHESDGQTTVMYNRLSYVYINK